MNDAFAKYSYPIPIPTMPSDDDLRVKQITDDEIALRMKLQEESNRYQWAEFNRKKEQRLELFLTIMTGVAIGVLVIELAAYGFFECF